MQCSSTHRSSQIAVGDEIPHSGWGFKLKTLSLHARYAIIHARNWKCQRAIASRSLPVIASWTKGWYIIVAWCRFFVPKIASAGIRPDDPELNENIMYAKCIKGHVLRDADDWILCENLPAPDAACWQEGGETLFSLRRKRSSAASDQQEASSEASTLPQRAIS